MVNWDFVVLFGTIMFWALLHVWSPDGRQWRTDRAEAKQPTPPLDAEVAPASRPRQS